MEQEKQDQLIQDLLNKLNTSGVAYGPHYQRDKEIPQSDWYDIVTLLTRTGLIEDNDDNYCITNEGKRFIGDRYKKQMQQARNQQARELQKKEGEENRENEKVSLELTQLRRQVKMFWPVLIVSLILNVCTITGLVIKFLEKPTIQKQYIPVDSHGKTYDLPK